MSENRLKLCVNCAHMIPKQATYSERCASPNNQCVDLVTGNLELMTEYCTHQRSGKFSGTCGKEGKWYVDKIVTKPKPIWPFSCFLNQPT